MIYLDNGAATPMDERVLEAMLPFMRDCYANPSAQYSFSARAKSAVRRAREQVAALINAEPDEIIFTPSGTVADNIAVRGAVPVDDSSFRLVCSLTEHSAVLETVRELGRRGEALTGFVGCDRYGYLCFDEYLERLMGGKGLASIMYVNNETGTVQDVENACLKAHERGFLFHTDAVAAALHVPIDVKKLKVDMLSASGHKLYGPKGSGFLYIRRGTRLNRSLFGGGQESSLMPGTENVPAIVGLGEACRILMSSGEIDEQRATLAADSFIEALASHKALTGDYLINRDCDRPYLSSTVSVSFKGIDSASLLVELDMKGLCCSAGAACHAGETKVSHVLEVMKVESEYIRGTLRFTFSKDNNTKEAAEAACIVAEAVNKLRILSGERMEIYNDRI